MAYVIGDDCIACGTCIDECPSGAISEGDKYSIDPDACTECGTCASVCPNEAIRNRAEWIVNPALLLYYKTYSNTTLV